MSLRSAALTDYDGQDSGRALDKLLQQRQQFRHLPLDTPDIRGLDQRQGRQLLLGRVQRLQDRIGPQIAIKAGALLVGQAPLMPARRTH